MPVPTMPLWGQLISNGLNNIRNIWKTSKERYNSMSPEQKAEAAIVGDQWVTDNVLPVVTTVGELIPQTSIPMAAYNTSEAVKKGNYEEAFQHALTPVLTGSVSKGVNLGLKASERAVDVAGKALKNADNYITIQNALRTGKLRFGEPTNYIGWHQSMEPIKHFEFPYNRWDVREHNADPNGVFFTLGSPVNSGFLGKRRFSLQFEIPSQKPLIQTGEVRGLLGKKNNTRNAIVKYAKKHGADAVEFRDIADNTLKHQDVLFMTDKINPELKKTINNRFVIREKLGPSYRLTLRDVREPNLDIGYLDLMRSDEHDMFIPAYIQNYTKDLKVPYRHISEDLYDAAIKTASENELPFVSGTVLESPEATTKIWRHYANNGKLKVLDNNGLHGDVPRQERVILTEPLYDTRIIDFDKQGGKMQILKEQKFLKLPEIEKVPTQVLATSASSRSRYQNGGALSMVNPNIVKNVVKNLLLRVIPAKWSTGMAEVAEYASLGEIPPLDSWKKAGNYGDWIIDTAGKEDGARNPGNAFLLDRARQRQLLEKMGYTLVKSPNYGPVNHAASSLNVASGDHIPIYQLGKDEIDESEVESTGDYVYSSYWDDIAELPNAHDYPIVIYRHKNTGDIYVRGWDLNDYGNHEPSYTKSLLRNFPVRLSNKLFGTNYDDESEERRMMGGYGYGKLQGLANLYDFVGNPFVQRTGLIRAPKSLESQYKKQGGKIKSIF